MNPMQILQAAMQAKQQFLQQNPDASRMNPQQIIQSLMNEGKVSQQQVEMARAIAGSIPGFKL